MAKRAAVRIGDACRLLDIQPYVLRYWETEFPVLQPQKSLSGQRTYSEHELAVIRRIKQLLYDEGYTIAGAKKKLEGELASGFGQEGDGASSLFATGEEAAPVDPPAATAPPALDSALPERIELLRTGLEGALAEAKRLQALLGPRAPR